MQKMLGTIVIKSHEEMPNNELGYMNPSFHLL